MTNLFSNKNMAELDTIAREIGTTLRDKYRVDVSQFKEKYGTVRVYCTFGWWNLHSLIYPGYHFNKFPRWLQRLDNLLLGAIVHQLGRFFIPLQKRAYRRQYAVAIVKYPHHRTAILDGADWPEYLKGL